MRFWKLAMSDHSESCKPTRYISPHSDLFADPLSESLTASHSEVWYPNKKSEKIAADCLQIPVLAAPDRSSPQGYSEKPPLTGKGSERSLVAARVQRISDDCGPSLKQGTSTIPLGLTECRGREGRKAHKSYEMGRRALEHHALDWTQVHLSLTLINCSVCAGPTQDWLSQQSLVKKGEGIMGPHLLALISSD